MMFMVLMKWELWVSMGFQDVAILLCQASFPTTFLNVVVEVDVSGPPHVQKLWLGVSKGMLPVEYLASFCVSWG